MSAATTPRAGPLRSLALFASAKHRHSGRNWVGRYDAACSTRFAAPLTEAIKDSELVVFEDCSHAPIYENVEEFNARTLAFLTRHAG